MCLKKRHFIEILNDYPDAKRLYYKRACDRRIEFRRVNFIFNSFRKQRATLRNFNKTLKERTLVKS